MKAPLLAKILGAMVLVLAMLAAGLFATGRGGSAGSVVTGLFAAVALYCYAKPRWSGFSFTAWVFVFVAAAMFYPKAFGAWFGFDLKFLIVPLVQIITFGMGTTLSAADFGRVLSMPGPVLLGMLLQFLVMPLTGFALAYGFGFAPEIGAGVILIGSVSGGVASNVMTYLARGNVALSVTMTACSTLLSPLLTPLLMKTLAGRLVPINVVAMMLEILNMVIVPIAAGLLANRILYSKNIMFQRVSTLAAITAAGLLVAVAAYLGLGESGGALKPLRNGLVIGGLLVSLVAIAQGVVRGVFRGPENWMERVLPIVSMLGICFIIAIITSRSRQQLLSVGLALIGAAIIHNGVGCLLGYWVAKLFRFEESTCRTMSFEVGMQNGGMASGLAMTVLKSADAALAPAIFGPWMNISGSVLASWWHGKPALCKLSSMPRSAQ